MNLVQELSCEMVSYWLNVGGHPIIIGCGPAHPRVMVNNVFDVQAGRTSHAMNATMVQQQQQLL